MTRDSLGRTAEAESGLRPGTGQPGHDDGDAGTGDGGVHRRSGAVDDEPSNDEPGDDRPNLDRLSPGTAPGESGVGAMGPGAEDGEPGPSTLETRYRRLLRVLPRAYRDLREDEMVGTFLTAEKHADPENFDLTLKHGSPSWTERRSIVALALRLRLANPQAPARSRLRVAAIQRALFGFLLLFAAMSVISAVTGVALLLWPPAWLDAMTPGAAGPAPSPWWTVMRWSFLAWIPALACALRGGRVALTAAAVFAAVPTVVAVTRLFTGITDYWAADRIVTAAVYLAMTLLLAAWAVVGTRVTAERARSWIVIAGVAALGFGTAWAALSATAHATADAGQSWWVLLAGALIVDEAGPLCWGVVLAAVVVAVRVRRGQGASAPGLLALGSLSATVLLLRLLGGIAWILATRGSDPRPAADVFMLGGLAVQVLALLLVAVLSVRAAGRAMRSAQPAPAGG